MLVLYQNKLTSPHPIQLLTMKLVRIKVTNRESFSTSLLIIS